MASPFGSSFTSIAHGSERSGRLGHRRDYGLADGSVEPNLLAVTLHASQPEAGLSGFPCRLNSSLHLPFRAPGFRRSNALRPNTKSVMADVVDYPRQEA